MSDEADFSISSNETSAVNEYAAFLAAAPSCVLNPNPFIASPAAALILPSESPFTRTETVIFPNAFFMRAEISPLEP